MGDYRKIEVWQRARALCGRIDALIGKLPPAMRPSVRHQLGRAVESIRHNIAEGTGLNSDRFLAKHLRFALGSANEAQDELETLDEKGLLPAEDKDLLREIAEIRAMLAAFLNRVLRDIDKAKKSRTAPRRADS